MPGRDVSELGKPLRPGAQVPAGGELSVQLKEEREGRVKGEAGAAFQNQGRSLLSRKEPSSAH